MLPPEYGADRHGCAAAPSADYARHGTGHPIGKLARGLGFTGVEILPGQGDPEAGRLVAHYMGAAAERALVPFVQGPFYQRMPDSVCAYVPASLLRSIRQQARDRAAQDNPALLAKLKQQAMPRRERDLHDLIMHGGGGAQP